MNSKREDSPADGTTALQGGRDCFNRRRRQQQQCGQFQKFKRKAGSVDLSFAGQNVVRKLFQTFPDLEKAIARHRSRIRPAPEKEDIIVEDIE
ncbi:Hypothetical predicted protein [Podarcis lilfordi]|uniref:Uncharacterized protein n=1 Tax=Podarcis lilfordi TaxID=74358 RepID=A0AA35PDX9_9SAUR|nr:Hypothetical predicted protein [Podarcis lilfordi]